MSVYSPADVAFQQDLAGIGQGAGTGVQVAGLIGIGLLTDGAGDLGATTRFISTDNGIVDVQPTLDRIESGGSFPSANDGSIFQNREGLLPTQPSGYTMNM
jgi:filamentous hemagglutinin